MQKGTKCGSNCAAASCQQKSTAKRSAQCDVFAQSPPGRRPNDKYPVNTSHRSDLCKYVSLHCDLVATVIHIQSVRSQMCGYISTCLHNTLTLVGQKGILKKIGEGSDCRAQEIFPREAGSPALTRNSRPYRLNMSLTILCTTACVTPISLRLLNFFS